MENFKRKLKKFTFLELIIVIAIIFLGPDNLPKAAANVAKMFKKVKSGVDEVKSTIDSELQISQMKEEAKNIQSQIGIDNLNKRLSLDEVLDIEDEFNNKKDKKNIEAKS